jgi:NAD-dependent dihydropyrimidine dehydrogenase PreA subunit
VWSPVLVSRHGYCDYSCNACGQVCPTTAIPKLPLEQKRNEVIGLAIIDEDRCIPFAEDVDCIVCEEMCPVPEKAIELEPHESTNKAGQTLAVLRPKVIEDLCIGCGICEHQCPVDGDAAIIIRRS